VAKKNFSVGIQIAKGKKVTSSISKEGVTPVPLPKRTPKNYEYNPATGSGMGIGIEPVKGKLGG
jgi:hypothetical protein